MKQLFKHSALSLLLFAFFMTSSGVVYYAHVCKMNHCYKGKVKRISPNSCKINLNANHTCHSKKVNKKENTCCDIEAEFEPLHQIDGAVNLFVFHLPPIIQVYQFEHVPFLASYFFTKKQNKPPPFLKLNRIVQFQDYRC